MNFTFFAEEQTITTGLASHTIGTAILVFILNVASGAYHRTLTTIITHVAIVTIHCLVYSFTALRTMSIIIPRFTELVICGTEIILTYLTNTMITYAKIITAKTADTVIFNAEITVAQAALTVIFIRH